MSVVLSSKSKSRNKKLDADSELLAKSFKQLKIATEAESECVKKGLEDLQFSIGTGQWDSSVKANREIEGKPCLTINRANSFLRQYTGEERQHRPSMIVSPVGNGADVEVAKIHQGALRHVEVASFADVTYDNLYDMMMRIGWSYGRIKSDYISDRSFAQEPRIEYIENPFSVYMSPVRKADGTDPLWCHVTEDLSQDEYIAQYGEKSQLAKLHFPSDQGNAPPDWVAKDGVRIAEYWWVELQPKTLCLMPDGSTRLRDELEKWERDLVENERDTVVRKVCCVKHNAIEVLERYEYLGKYIPILELSGIRLNVNGKIYKAGMVRDYRDAQRIYDFMVTRQVEHVDLYSKDPLWIPEENANHAEEYRQINRKNYAFQYFKAYDSDNKPLPQPYRMSREVPIEAMSKVIQQADYDMKAVIGIYGPGLGEQGPDNESGFAILSRQQQSDTGMVNWHDNLNRFIRNVGKVLLDLWPRLIDEARIQRIVNPDDSVKHAVVYNSEYSGHDDAQALLDGETLKRAYDVGAGDYDVVLSTGPQYRTARQETFRALTVVITQKPELLPILGDVWAKNADFPDAHIIADRLKKMLPPQLQDDTDDSKEAQLAKAQAMLQEMGAQHQQLVAELARASDTIRTKRLEIESRERVALENNRTQLLLQQMKSHDEAAQAHLQAQLDTISHRLETLHESMSIEEEAGAPPPTPELPGKVEPKPQPVTPVTPTPPVPGTTG